MDDASDIPDRPKTPLQRHVRIESDLFCRHCGYNLYTQPVHTDERLGLLIVRCPECGRFESANAASNATRPWVLRIATILLAFWAFSLITLIAFGTFGLGGLQVAHVESLSQRYWVTPDGEVVDNRWDPQSRQIQWVRVSDGTVMQVSGGLSPSRQRSFHLPPEIREYKVASAMIIGGMLLAPFLFAVLLVTLMWHVPRRRHWVFLVLPWLAAAFLLAIFHIDESDSRGDGGTADVAASVGPILGFAALEQTLMMLAGTFAGRPIARFLLTIFIPPRPRQALAFLWTVDGKAPPSPAQYLPVGVDRRADAAGHR